MKRLIFAVAIALCAGCATIGEPVDGLPPLDAGEKWSVPMEVRECMLSGKKLKQDVYVVPMPVIFLRMVTERFSIDDEVVLQVRYVLGYGYKEGADIYLKTRFGWRKLEGKEINSPEPSQTTAFQQQTKEAFGASLDDVASCLRGSEK